MNEAAHIIERVNIDVDVQDMDTAKHIRDNVSQFLYGRVFPQLEMLLNGVTRHELYYRVDRLSFDLNFDSTNNFEDQFSIQLLEQLGKTITKELGERAGNVLQKGEKEKFEFHSTPEKRWQVFLYFLKTGRLPWFVSASEDWLDEKELEEMIERDWVDWRPSLQKMLHEHKPARSRLMLQFHAVFVIRLISHFLDIDLQEHPRLRELFLEKSLTDFRASFPLEFFFDEVIAIIAGPASSPEIISKKVEQDIDTIINRHTVSEKDNKDHLDNQKKEHGKKNEEDEEGLFVEHAGLILLHPFIQYFFAELGLLNDKHFKDESSRKTAVHLLFFLATGQQHPMEHELLMEKYLCGMYVHEPLERFLELTDAMKQEGDQMLKAVIGHWKMLKNTSPDGLREAFLQRGGKLIINEREQLIVESKSIDVLLDKLPWGYSIIKLPWMMKELYVDWN